MTPNIPDGAAAVIKKLNGAGYKAYASGSTVRELLLGNDPRRCEIVTDASAQTVRALFGRTVGGGGDTVTVIVNKSGCELICGKPLDGGDACADRDFTINAVLYHPLDGIWDPRGGRADMAARLIRSVGEPERSFRRDPVRMLRAVRFEAVLGFDMEEKTERAAKKCALLIRKAKPEQIRDELNNILVSERPGHIRRLRELGLLRFIIPELDLCFGEPQRNKYHIYDVGEHIMRAVENTPPDLTLRWAALLHDTGKPCCPSTDSNGIIHFYGHHRESRRITVDVLHRLHMDSDMIRDTAVLVENHDYRVDANYIAVKRMMSKTGAELFEKLLELQNADNKAKNPLHISDKLKRTDAVLEIYRSVIARKQPYRVSDLTVNASDLANIGLRPGREAGDTLKALLDEVIIKPELNTRPYLLKRAKEMKRRRKK